MPTDATFLLAGLFIILAATGWAFAWFGERDKEQPPARINADYLKGLNLVLNRRTDEALELFLQMAKVDDDTLETHFALGHLFRRRGEVERAMVLHLICGAKKGAQGGAREGAANADALHPDLR